LTKSFSFFLEKLTLVKKIYKIEQAKISHLTPDRMAYEEADEFPDREKAREFYSKYELKDVLGKGISSVVRKCIEKSSGKEYAVKIVEYSGPEVKESTLREIEIMKLIGGHPNIIEIHDTFESDSFVFIVMEL
jgi:phosphorylase kinase gamma subunit